MDTENRFSPSVVSGDADIEQACASARRVLTPAPARPMIQQLLQRAVAPLPVSYQTKTYWVVDDAAPGGMRQVAPPADVVIPPPGGNIMVGPEKDAVHRPNHYARFAIEPITFIMANNIGFAAGNVIKYVMRWDAKDGLQDLEKARRYLDMMIEDAKRKLLGDIAAIPPL